MSNWKVILLSAVFTLMGYVMLRDPHAPHWVAWLLIIFFGLGGLVPVAKVLIPYTPRGTAMRRHMRAAENYSRGRNEFRLKHPKEHHMGADAYVAFYGIKIALDPDDEEVLDACGAGTDPRCVTAKRVGLETLSDRMTNGEDYFLYVGINLGTLGLENSLYASIPPQRLTEIMASVQSKLKEAGLTQQPALHLQFVGQY